MIYAVPQLDDPLDQGDLILGHPLLDVATWDAADFDRTTGRTFRQQVVVLTQTCDFANAKTSTVTVAEVFDADAVVAAGLFKAADVRGPLRATRVWGWYFLPADPSLGLGEMIVDLRRTHTVRRDLTEALCRAGARPARLPTPYREHLAKHFADTFSRIGLPRPYETL